MTLTESLETTYDGATSGHLVVSGLTRGRVSAAPLAGELTSAVFTLQHSVNGIDFFDTAATVTAPNISDEVDLEGVAFLRVQVTTASAATATARITIYAERA